MQFSTVKKFLPGLLAGHGRVLAGVIQDTLEAAAIRMQSFRVHGLEAASLLILKALDELADRAGFNGTGGPPRAGAAPVGTPASPMGAAGEAPSSSSSPPPSAGASGRAVEIARLVAVAAGAPRGEQAQDAGPEAQDPWAEVRRELAGGATGKADPVAPLAKAVTRPLGKLVRG